MINFDLIFDIVCSDIETNPPKVLDVAALTDCEEDGVSIEVIETPEDIDAAIGWLTNRINEYTRIKEYLLSKAD